MEELTEWAQKERLGVKFQSSLAEIVSRGGLQRVNDQVLLGLGIQFGPMRNKILKAIKRRLVGTRTVRFGDTVIFEPILKKPPKYSQCPWVDVDEMEVRRETAILKAAFRTWRFCATGMDGLEEVSQMQEVFDAWKPKPKAGNCVLQGILWIHLLIPWILHDSPSLASLDIFDAASILFQYKDHDHCSSEGSGDTPSRSQGVS